jgi:uncharacterized protein (TIGR03546 family)
MLKYIVKLFKALNSNSNPAEISHAVSLAFLLGILPKNNLLWYIIFIFCCFIRINKGAYGLFILVFSLFAHYLDPLLNRIGFYILNLSQLENIYSFLIDIPFVGFTHFNNTIVMGALVLGIILYLPIFFISLKFIKLWRNKLAYKFKNSKAIKFFNKIPLIKKIVSVSNNLNNKLQEVL